MNSTIQLKRITSTFPIAIALVLVHWTALAAPDGNTSLGVGALPGGAIGRFNTAVGYQAISTNKFVGSFNTAIGEEALESLGLFGGVPPNNNIAVGAHAGSNITTGSYNIDIGNDGQVGDSGTIRIGDSNQTKTFITGISGVTVTGTGVVVNASGQLGVAASSARFKDQIKPMDKASEAILSLKPVAFRYKKEIDPARSLQFGLVAEEVEKVNPDLVACDGEGKPFSVRYEAVNAMLLNEFLKEHRKVEQLKKDFESKIAKQQKQIEALTAGLQKVSAQIEVSKSGPQTVLNNQ